MTPLQQKEFEILSEFIKVCKKLSLTYFLVCGSALGAVKYNGFIPWDDDVDVALPREDYEIFIKEAAKHLPRHLFVQNSYTDPNFPKMYTKLRDSQTTFIEKTVSHIKMNHGIFIDVFPLDGYPKKKLSQKKTEIFKRYYETIYLSVADFKKSGKTKIVHGLINLLGLNKNMQKITKKYTKLVSKYKTDSSDIWCNHGNWQGKLEYAPSYQYGKGFVTTFEGIEVIVPEKYDEYLTQKYGNWRADLPEEHKKGHHTYFALSTFVPYSEYPDKKI
jgi:lipopolysaccharide cholinephosphotransferase